MAYTTIDDPSAYFHTQLYTGTGSSNAITNDGNSDLQPDWIWLKDRSATNGHAVQDTSRGITNVIFTNGTDYENQYTNTVVDSVQSDGFTVSTNANSNTNTNNYVAWQWKANGGTTSSNTDGTITSTVQANTDAGFSIVSYSGNGVNGATVGHGLGVQPEIIFVKRRNANASGQGSNWPLRSTLLTAQQVMYLDLSDGAGNSTTMFNNTYPNTTTFTIGDNEATNAFQTSHSFTGTYIAYCFASIQGYSKFGSYTGNGSADGPMVYCGFKPAWVMFKRTDTADLWYIKDYATSPNNPAINTLFANATNTTNTNANAYVDFLSNGIKIRGNDAGINASGGTYIYMCFASSPFVSSEGVPTTAR